MIFKVTILALAIYFSLVWLDLKIIILVNRKNNISGKVDIVLALIIALMWALFYAC